MLFTAKLGINDHVDVALVALYTFWLLFAVLIWWLLREGRREGFPIVRPEAVSLQGFASEIPDTKRLLLHDGTISTPRPGDRDTSRLLERAEPWWGAPYVPTGNPMQDGVGPAAWCDRADVPDMAFDEQVPKIVPLRVANGFYVAERDPDPRGYWLVGTDDRVAGTVTDLWVDRSETLVRYIEAEVRAPDGTMRAVIVPSFMTTVDRKRRQIRVDSVLAEQIADAPAIRSPNQITLLEEDKIQAYFAGGHMYATPKRQGPLL